MFLKNSKILAPNEYFSIRLHSRPCSILVTREIGDLLPPFQEYSVRSRIFSLACLQTCLGYGAFQIAGGGEGKFRFCKLFETHTRGAPVTRILSGRLSWNFHDFPPPSFSTRICISWFFYVHHFLFTTRYIFHQNIYIYFFSLLYYRTFILNLSIPFPLFLKKLKNSNLQWFINKQSSSNDSKRITV